MKKYLLIVLLTFCFPATLHAQPDTQIQQAYDALQVQRTTFTERGSKIKGADSTYLQRLFNATDEIMAVRVSTLQQLYYNDNAAAVDNYNAVVDEMLESLTRNPAPKHLGYVETTIIGAIQEQQKFLNMWANAKGTEKFQLIKNSYGTEPLVLSSHQKLLNAYGELMAIYAYENGHNKKAFYSHLCALDFI